MYVPANPIEINWCAIKIIVVLPIFGLLSNLRLPPLHVDESKKDVFKNVSVYYQVFFYNVKITRVWLYCNQSKFIL